MSSPTTTGQVAVVTGLDAIVGATHVLTGDAITPELTTDEALGSVPVRPLAVVLPGSAGEVASIVALGRATATPVVARGGATGLSGGCLPSPDGIVISFARMNRILEVDEQNHVAVVQPGVTLQQLDEELSGRGLVYPVHPGELTATIGGNVATNAGGMRAVRHGVTRQHVLGLEAVLGTGETIRIGGKIAKSSSGYDLGQLIIGSEGTLALVTEATLRIWPRLPHAVTVLAPFVSLEELMAAVPAVVGSGLAPSILEYIDALTMRAITDSEGIDLGLAADVQAEAEAYLVVVLEQTRPERIDEDVEALGSLLLAAGRAGSVRTSPGCGRRSRASPRARLLRRKGRRRGRHRGCLRPALGDRDVPAERRQARRRARCLRRRVRPRRRRQRAPIGVPGRPG